MSAFKSSMLLLAEFLPWAGPGIGRAAQGPGDFPCQEEGFKPVPQMPPGLRGKVTQVEILALLHDLGRGGGGVEVWKSVQRESVSSSGTETHLDGFNWHTEMSNTWCLLQSTSKIVWEGGFHRAGRITTPTVPVWAYGPRVELSPASISLTASGLKGQFRDFPGGPVVKNLPANAGDTVSVPDPGRSHMLWSL